MFPSARTRVKHCCTLLSSSIHDTRYIIDMDVSFLVSTAGCAVVGLLLCYLHLKYSGPITRLLQRGFTNKLEHSPYAHIGRKHQFPTEWWTSREQLALEIRAVLSKASASRTRETAFMLTRNQEWLLATHSSRFRKAGDYISVTVGSFPILLVMGKDLEIRGFHDVCRHRAYKVSRKSAGSSLVFGCRYHGWSYDTKGALVKAPEFEKVSTFQWKENGLLPVHVRISQEGLVFVNFSREKVPRFEHDGLRSVLPSQIQGRETAWIRETAFEAAFNWKLQSAAALAQTGAGAEMAEMHLFPSARICWNLSAGFWATLTYEPISADRTQIKVNVYGVDDSRKVSEAKLSTFEEHIAALVKRLEQLHAQLNSGTPLQAEYTGRLLGSTWPQICRPAADVFQTSRTISSSGCSTTPISRSRSVTWSTASHSSKAYRSKGLKMIYVSSPWSSTPMNSFHVG